MAICSFRQANGAATGIGERCRYLLNELLVSYSRSDYLFLDTHLGFGKSVTTSFVRLTTDSGQAIAINYENVIFCSEDGEATRIRLLGGKEILVAGTLDDVCASFEVAEDAMLTATAAASVEAKAAM